MERIKISSKTKAGLLRTQAKRVQSGRRSTITDAEINRVWEEYEHEGTISRDAKIAAFSKGTVYFIIKNEVHSREEYLQVKRKFEEIPEYSSKNVNKGPVK